MNSETKNGGSRCGRFAASLALLFGLSTAGTASAQGWPVYDNLHTLKNVMGWMEAHKQDLKEIDQWKKQAEHYKQQLADAQKIFDAQSMTMTMDFTERPLNFGMPESCPDKTGNGDQAISSNITSAPMSYAPVKPDSKGNIKNEQLKVCQQIVFMQNSKYNEMIKMLKNIQQREGAEETGRVPKRSGYQRGQAGHQQQSVQCLHGPRQHGSAVLANGHRYLRRLYRAFERRAGEVGLACHEG